MSSHKFIFIILMVFIISSCTKKELLHSEITSESFLKNEKIVTKGYYLPEKEIKEYTIPSIYYKKKELNHSLFDQRLYQKYYLDYILKKEFNNTYSLFENKPNQIKYKLYDLDYNYKKQNILNLHQGIEGNINFNKKEIENKFILNLNYKKPNNFSFNHITKGSDTIIRDLDEDDVSKLNKKPNKEDNFSLNLTLNNFINFILKTLPFFILLSIIYSEKYILNKKLSEINFILINIKNKQENTLKKEVERYNKNIYLDYKVKKSIKKGREIRMTLESNIIEINLLKIFNKLRKINFRIKIINMILLTILLTILLMIYL